MKFLITGGAGFIGGNYLHIMPQEYPDDEFVCLDALTHMPAIWIRCLRSPLLQICKRRHKRQRFYL